MDRNKWAILHQNLESSISDQLKPFSQLDTLVCADGVQGNIDLRKQSYITNCGQQLTLYDSRKSQISQNGS